MKSSFAGLILRLRIAELQRAQDEAMRLVLQSQALAAQAQAVALPLHALAQTRGNSGSAS